VCETPATSTTTAEGGWFGTTADGRMVRAIILDDGTYYVVYSFPGVRTNAGVVQGSSSAANGNFASSDGADFPISFAAETAGSATSAAVSGTYVPRTSLQLSIVESTATRTFTASYDAGFEQPASLAAAAGTYTGKTGHVSGAIPASFTLDSSGNIVGHNAACSFTGTVTPHKSVNVFDWTIVGPNCVFGRAGASGVMYYDETNRELNGFAPFAARDDQFYLLGAKP